MSPSLDLSTRDVANPIGAHDSSVVARLTDALVWEQPLERGNRDVGRTVGGAGFAAKCGAICRETIDVGTGNPSDIDYLSTEMV